jgi:PAS domain S-box-containing protein
MSLESRLRDVPVKRKLLYLVALSLAAATLFAMALALVEQWFIARGELKGDLLSHARLIGANTGTALLFSDQAEAEKTLLALENIENIEFAEVLDRFGKPFARYVKEGEDAPEYHHLISGEQFHVTAASIEVGLPIVIEGEQIGSIHLISNLWPMYEKMAWSMLLLLAAMLAGLGVAAALVARLHPVVTAPIAGLLGVMGRVSREKNYALRAELHGKDELGRLAGEFNDMLAQIQLRDEALEKHRAQLGEEVSARTAELRETNRLLEFELIERKQAEDALRESEERFRTAFQTSAIGMALVGLDGRWLKVNDALCQIIGYPEAELLQKTFQDVTHPADLQADLELLGQLLAGEIGNYQMEKRYLHKDGRVVWVRLSVSLVRDAQGEPVHFVSQIEDITRDKLADEALHKANVELSLFRTLMDNSTDGIEVLDPETLHFLDVSEKECNDLGYSREELLSMTVFDIDPAVDESSAKRVMEQIRESGFARFESVHRRKDGSVFPVEISVRVVELDRPYMLGMVRDITERRQAEEALRASQLRYGELFGAIADAAYVHEILPDGMPGKFVEANEQACRYTGYTREELLSMSPMQLDAPDSGVDLRPVSARLMAGETVTFEQVHIGKDGRRIPVEIHAHSFVLNGRPVVISIVRDITERKRAEELLRESEARYRGIFEYADDIIYLLEADGSFRSLSPSFERITGWNVAEWIGKPFAPIVHPDDLAYANDVFLKALAGESTPTFRLRIARKSGVYFDADLSITPIGREPVTGALGIARDVTERQQMEEKVQKLNEELEIKVQERTRQLLEAQAELVRKEKLAVLGQVAGSVGHELRNPLGVMNNAVYFLQTVLADADESVREYLEIIKGEIAGSERIVSDLLDSVRTKPPRPEAVGVAQLVEQVLGKYAIPPSVSVRLDIPAVLPPLRVDAMQIHQVLRNLVSNGVEAMPEGGTLEIRVRESGDARNMTVGVRDTGVGMTQEQLGHLFQPLFTTKARGIGLGLVVVKNLTEANGGKVEVQSEPGKGTTFTLTLPAGSEAVETA